MLRKLFNAPTYAQPVKDNRVNHAKGKVRVLQDKVNQRFPKAGVCLVAANT